MTQPEPAQPRHTVDEELRRLRIAQAGHDLALQAACRKTQEQRERAEQAEAEVEHMKLLVASSSEEGQAVRMAAQYAERAIENGERAEKAEVERAHAVRIARSAAFDTAKALTAQLLADERAERAEATLTAVRRLLVRAEKAHAAGASDYDIGKYNLAVRLIAVLDQHGQTPKEPAFWERQHEDYRTDDGQTPA